MKKVLVIGSQGSLGQEMVEIFADLDLIFWSHKDVDVTNREEIIIKVGQVRPDVVINCTAYNAVDRAEEEPDGADRINNQAVGYLVEACGPIDAELVHYSTHYVFDGGKIEGYTEDDQPNPLNAYAKSKFAGEQKALKYPKSYVIRTAWLYGKPGMGETSKKSFVQVMLDLIKEKPTIEVVNDQFGNPTYTKDVAQGTRVLLEEGKPFGLYHFINEGAASWLAWAEEIFDIKSLEVRIKPVSYKQFVRKAAVPQHLVLQNTKFIKFRPWQEALNEFLSSN
jgi:dTDP-4-dehydrorhamnose reductase